ncbi:hypothetical protein N9J72_02480 [Candidatus Gracilibacteria bacterium]|nr:hypothetical protein [Candidatus Gracilibacteria bacterium]
MRIISHICVLLAICIGFFSASVDAATGDCVGSGCITSADFKISVGAITPGGTSLINEQTGTEGTVDNILTEILNKLILVFGAFSILIMTIGAGYMIIYHGQDEFLSKGKSIFISGIIALAVALSAGLIVQLFTILLY